MYISVCNNSVSTYTYLYVYVCRYTYIHIQDTKNINTSNTSQCTHNYVHDCSSHPHYLYDTGFQSPSL